MQQDADAKGQANAIKGLLGDQAKAAELSKDYEDADGDLLADVPKDAAKQLDPDELVIADVASSDSEGQEATWKELIDALAKGTGKKVTLATYADTSEQMRALKDGSLHITSFSTGEAPAAVNHDGFVPVACYADKEGNHLITMKIIVPADSPVKTLEDLRPTNGGGEAKKHRITFVRPRSNSGCTAALVVLMDKLGLQPERDYTWGFSYGHENSIKGIAEKKFEAAAVASDILKRMIANGDIADGSIREIYESEPFPPGVIGVAYNLKPELQAKIRDTLFGFDWTGTGLEKKYQKVGWVKFAPVSYKDDWAPVRKISETGGTMLSQLEK
jgi:phosphonate transport system substrate-binding protein